MIQNLRAQWLTLIDTYGQTPRLLGAAKVASAAHAPQTDGWYTTAITVFWN